MIDQLARLGYAGLARAARALASIAPGDSQSKIARTFAARRDLVDRYRAWGASGRDRSRPLVWFHAPSVGEGLQARPVLERLRQRRPDLQLAYTHFSPSAERFAAGLDVDFRAYLPFDVAEDCDAILDALSPDALIFSKLDIWPELVRSAKSRSVPLGLISGTVSPGSGRRGFAARFLREAYSMLDCAGAIDREDASRLAELGVRHAVLEVTGDTRYDQVWERALRASIFHPVMASLAGPRPTVVAGSTWPSDEAVLLPAWLQVRERVPDTRLILAPHEPTPSHLDPIANWANTRGLRIARLSAAAQHPATDIVLVDRVGVLGELYVLATAAYVGGGFHGAGLHSVLEPAAYGAPVLFGPRHTESRDARLLLDAGAAKVAADADALARNLAAWLTDPDARARAGAAARSVVESGLGAADRSTELVLRLLGPTTSYQGAGVGADRRESGEPGP